MFNLIQSNHAWNANKTKIKQVILRNPKEPREHLEILRNSKEPLVSLGPQGTQRNLKERCETIGNLKLAKNARNAKSCSKALFKRNFELFHSHSHCHSHCHCHSLLTDYYMSAALAS